MPTNEKLLEWGICPVCEYGIIIKGNDTLTKEEVYICRRCEYWSTESWEFLALDTLQQMFAEWKQQEFELFKAGIILCAEARRRGVASTLAEYRGYTKQSINRLAALEDLPEYLWSPELPQGIYWQALLMSSNGDDVDMDKFAQLIEEAIVNSWSLREFKERHGIATPDRRQPVYEGTAEEVRAGINVWRLVEVKVY